MTRSRVADPARPRGRDDELDPHSPKHGFTWAHMFWCMHKQPEGRDPAAAARDLLARGLARLEAGEIRDPREFLE